MIYCFVITCWIPPFILSGVFGKKTPEAQRAFREKMGIVAICALLMGIVGFITFGFTQVVCGVQKLRIKGGHVDTGSVVLNGFDYDLSTWKHPVAGTEFNGTTSPIYMDGWMAGAKDISFLFQNVNKKCRGLLTPGANAPEAMKGPDDTMMWYFPCNLFEQNTTIPVNKKGYEEGTNCHASTEARNQLENDLDPAGIVYYTWDQVQDLNRNLAVFKG